MNHNNMADTNFGVVNELSVSQGSSHALQHLQQEKNLAFGIQRKHLFNSRMMMVLRMKRLANIFIKWQVVFVIVVSPPGCPLAPQADLYSGISRIEKLVRGVQDTFRFDETPQFGALN
jgi:hypothetical protein